MLCITLFVFVLFCPVCKVPKTPQYIMARVLAGVDSIDVPLVMRGSNKYVELPFDAEEVYADILAGRADERALMAATGHPNTYTLTKCINEHLVSQRRGDVPLSIVRPWSLFCVRRCTTR